MQSCCFKVCARNAALICILIEAWGGTAKKKGTSALVASGLVGYFKRWKVGIV
jgi:hypothetical protein